MILQLPPGYTAIVQLKVRTVGSDTPGANVGSPITGSASGVSYTFNLGAYETGDYWAQLSGVSNPVGLPFPVRNGVAYVGFSWAQVNVFAPSTPTAPPSIVSGLCNVLCAVTDNGSVVSGATVACHLEAKNNTLVSHLASRAIETGTTNESGYCVLTLIQIGQFTRGGIYIFKAHDENGKLLADRRVTVPNVSECNASDLLDIVAGATPPTPPTPTPTYTPSLDFSDARNSQYIALLFADDLALAGGGGGGGGGVTESMDFSITTNSQYLVLIED